MTEANRDVAAGRWLEHFTLGWNALEAVIALGLESWRGVLPSLASASIR
jgi:predicted phage-related endonuclease